MELTWIGTGSGLNPALGNTSFIAKEGDRTLLVDCGATVPLALVAQKRIGEITDIVITHAHADHIAGLEGLGFMHYFALKRRNEKRPHLYVGSVEFAHDLWERSLVNGMQKAQTDDNVAFDATLDTYFKIHTGSTVQIPGFPKIDFFPTPHVQGMENYGLLLGERALYSGDTIALPPSNPDIIFQDCQFYETAADVHVSYAKLKTLSADVRKKMHLVHLGGGYAAIDAKADGFAGFVMPGDKFEI